MGWRLMHLSVTAWNAGGRRPRTTVLIWTSASLASGVRAGRRRGSDAFPLLVAERPSGWRPLQGAGEAAVDGEHDAGEECGCWRK